jgi:hypothetical protein
MIDRIQPQLSENAPVFSVQGGMQPLVASQSSALRFDIPSWSRFLISRFQHSNAFVDEWQTDGQSKTFALATFDGELPAVFAHDAADN